MKIAYLSAVIEDLKWQIENFENELESIKDEKKDLIAEWKERYSDMENELRYEIWD